MATELCFQETVLYQMLAHHHLKQLLFPIIHPKGMIADDRHTDAQKDFQGINGHGFDDSAHLADHIQTYRAGWDDAV
jgi:hypothetical protein